jgi:hypothetical protein
MSWITLRVYRVRGFLSSRPNWSLNRKGVFPPPFWVQEGETHSLAGEEEVGDPIPGTDTLVSHVGILLSLKGFTGANYTVVLLYHA